MAEENLAINKTDQPVAVDQTVVNTVAEDDTEARIALLEAEKAKAIEEASNYQLAFMKEKQKNASKGDFEDETEEEKIRRITREELSQTKIAQIDAEKEALLKKVIKENKELRLAHLNNTNTPPATLGTHSEGFKVTDTSITPEQLSAFKARGWSDKDIERYKKNLQKFR